MNTQIKQIRQNIGMTQEEFSKLLGIPINTIRNWEQEIRRPSDWMIDLVIDQSLKYKTESNQKIDEETGVLSFTHIKRKVCELAKEYDVDKIYLFGSYVKGEATNQSDIDIYMQSKLFGLEYFEFAEALREKLGKKVELLSNKTIDKNSVIEDEILRTGVLIYERKSIY
jgi:predicted nucleotidyltransferase